MRLLSTSTPSRNRRGRRLRRLATKRTRRSPVAQAVCSAEIAARLRLTPDALAVSRIDVRSAGLAAEPGKPIKSSAEEALAQLGVPVPEHAAQPLTPAMIRDADVIFCMTEAQRRAVIETFPLALPKTCMLDPESDLEEPADEEAVLAFARQSQTLIRQHLNDIALNEDFKI